MKPALVANEFKVDGWLVSAVYVGGGNVNDTYDVIFRTVFSEERIVLQHINRKVFKEPEKIMHNMHLVTEHAHQRLIKEHDSADRIWQLPRVILTRKGEDFAIDQNGEYWRAISRIASAHAFDFVQNADHAREVGAVLGKFHSIISDIPCETLHDTLPGFHITPMYLAEYDRVCKTPLAQQLMQSSQVAKNVAQFIEERRDIMDVLEKAKERGELKIRPIHGDPKTANVMIDDATMKGTAMIDLDTVKPGLIHYDIGDCLRSCCNPAGEECEDFSQIRFDLAFCKALLRGYKAQSDGILTEADKAYLYDSVRLITLELAMRFFTDYLAGDVYFKVKFEGENLLRARVQMVLCRSIETLESQIRQILESL